LIDFTFFSNPQLLFSPGKFKHLPELINQYGKKSHPLVALLDKWTALLDMPTLGSYGGSGHYSRIMA
jgi:hypothetical protein